MQELDGAVNKSQDELSLESEKDTEHSKTGLLLRRPGGKLISDHLKLPGLLIEFERAIEQLERQFTRESK